MKTIDGFKYLIHSLMRDNGLCHARVRQLVEQEESSNAARYELNEKHLLQTLKIASYVIPAYRYINAPKENLGNFIQSLPILTKHDLLTNPRVYYPSLGLKRYITSAGMTSGTTGTPLTIYRSLDSVIWEYAFIQRHWSWSGFERGMPRATLRGDNVTPADKKTPPFWHYNRWENQLILSSRHLRPPYIEQIIEKLRSFNPYILQAYPSTAYEVARHLSQHCETLDIPYIYTGSEMLYPHQRELIANAFNARVMDFYGMAERVTMATQCEHGNYHINPEYSYVEIVDEDGHPTSDEGFIVGTTFHNSAMPLIRYRLSDRSKWKPGQCPCGRSYPMIEPIAGKYEDRIYGSAGTPISPSIVTFAFKGLHNIERAQVAQIGLAHWEIRVIPMTGFSTAEKEQLVHNIHNLVDPDIKLDIVECTDIPRTAAGKYRWVVNEWRDTGTLNNGQQCVG